jgi:MFS family permease
MLMAIATMCHFNRISITVAGNERIIEEYGVNPTLMGTVYSAYLLTYTICMTPGGWLIDRRGPRTALVLMGIGSVVLVALTGAAGLAFPSPMPVDAASMVGLLPSPAGQGNWLSISTLVASRALGSAWLLVLILWLIRGSLGVVSAPMHPAGAQVVSFWIPAPVRGLANGLVVSAALVGIAATYWVFGFVMDEFGWPVAFMLAAVATGVVTGLWTFGATDRPQQHRRTNEAERRLIDPTGLHEGPGRQGGGTARLLRNRSLLWLTLSYAAVGYFQYLFFYWVEYYFLKILEFEKHQGRICTTILNLAMAGGMLLGGRLMDHFQHRWGLPWGRRVVPAVGMIASALLVALAISTSQAVWAVSCFTLAMAAIGATEGAFWVTAIDLGGRRGGTAAGILNTGGNAGGVLAPVVTPLISYYFDWKSGFLMAGLFCLIGAALWWRIDPSERTAELP